MVFHDRTVLGHPVLLSSRIVYIAFASNYKECAMRWSPLSFSSFWASALCIYNPLTTHHKAYVLLWNPFLCEYDAAAPKLVINQINHVDCFFVWAYRQEPKYLTSKNSAPCLSSKLTFPPFHAHINNNLSLNIGAHSNINVQSAMPNRDWDIFLRDERII